MTSNRSILEKLPKVMENEVSGYLKVNDFVSLARTNKQTRQIFQQSFSDKKLFLLMELADYDNVEKMVGETPSLMFAETKIKNKDGQYKLTNPLKYAFEMYDTHMWKIFLKTIQNQPPLLARFLAQLEKKKWTILTCPQCSMLMIIIFSRSATGRMESR